MKAYKVDATPRLSVAACGDRQQKMPGERDLLVCLGFLAPRPHPVPTIPGDGFERGWPQYRRSLPYLVELVPNAAFFNRLVSYLPRLMGGAKEHL